MKFVILITLLFGFLGTSLSLGAESEILNGLKLTLKLDHLAMSPFVKDEEVARSDYRYDLCLLFENVSSEPYSIPLHGTVSVIKGENVIVRVQVFDNAVSVKGVGTIIPKPSRSDLNLVELGPGEVAMMKVGRFSFESGKLSKLTVHYFVSEELERFYDIWTGKLVIEKGLSEFYSERGEEEPKGPKDAATDRK